MSTVVQRAPSDRPGDAIISSILTTVSARLERGTYEVNDQMDDRVIMDGSVVDLDFYQPGGMCRVYNRGSVKNGLIIKHGGRIKIGRTIDVRTTTAVETIK